MSVIEKNYKNKAIYPPFIYQLSSMKVALIGYGKMGRAIEQIIEKETTHQVVLKIDSRNAHLISPQYLQQADVAIEFTRPQSAIYNIQQCFAANIPVVCGTTGWANDLEMLKQQCIEQNQAFLWASNFSVGVHIFGEITRLLAKLMANRHEYDLLVKEIHHLEKLDAPSGTAISLAKLIMQADAQKTSWVNQLSSQTNEISIVSERLDEVKGTHIITYTSEVDTIAITHTAHSREGFAKGAIMAAEWIIGKKGVFELKDLFE